MWKQAIRPAKSKLTDGHAYTSSILRIRVNVQKPVNLVTHLQVFGV